MKPRFDTKVLYSWIKANPIYFKKLIALYYPLDSEQLERFNDERGWLNYEISCKSIEPYYNTLDYYLQHLQNDVGGTGFIGIRSFPGKREYQSRHIWYWDLISDNEKIKWSFDLILKYSDRWHSCILENQSIPWNVELIDFFFDHFKLKETNDEFLNYNPDLDNFYYTLNHNKSVRNNLAIITKYPAITEQSYIGRFDDYYDLVEFFIQVYSKKFNLKSDLYHSIKKNEWSLSLINSLYKKEKFRIYFENDRIFNTLLNNGIINKEIVDYILSIEPAFYNFNDCDAEELLRFCLEKNEYWHEIIYDYECYFHFEEENLYIDSSEIYKYPQKILTALFQIEHTYKYEKCEGGFFETSFDGKITVSNGLGHDHIIKRSYKYLYEVFNFKVNHLYADYGMRNLMFGKFKSQGITISEIFLESPDYVEWLLLNTDYTIDEYLLLNKFPYINSYKLSPIAVLYNHMKLQYIESYIDYKDDHEDNIIGLMNEADQSSFDDGDFVSPGSCFGIDSDTINDAFDGDPMNTLNID